MSKYNNGKIYKLVSNSVEGCYYGSTTQPLSHRIRQHRSDYKRWKAKIKRNCTSFKLFEGGDVDIILVEDYPCESKEQLHSRERHWIENNECLNKNIPTRTDSEYYQANRDKIYEKNIEWRKNNPVKLAQYMKKWRKNNHEKAKAYDKKKYEKHRDKILAQCKKKVTCECGTIVQRRNIIKHKTTDKHKNLIQSQDTPQISA